MRMRALKDPLVWQAAPLSPSRTRCYLQVTQVALWTRVGREIIDQKWQANCGQTDPWRPSHRPGNQLLQQQCISITLFHTVCNSAQKMPTPRSLQLKSFLYLSPLACQNRLLFPILPIISGASLRAAIDARWPRERQQGQKQHARWRPTYDAH